MSNIWQRVIKLALTSHEQSINGAVILNDTDERLSPNVRALRLAMTIADILLSMNTPVNDIVVYGLDITDAYCKKRVQFDISSGLILASQDRGNDREPLTLMRTVRPRYMNMMTVQRIKQLIYDIVHQNLTLDDAEIRLEYIMKHPQTYPLIITTVGSGMISAGVSILFAGTPLMIAMTFFMGMFVSYSLHVFYQRLIPAFFVQAIAAFIITMIGAWVAWLGGNGISYLTSINANLIVISGIVLLAAGLAVVAAVQDAIDEYYVTATARLLRVLMMTIGIVGGVTIGLYVANRIGMYLNVSTEVPPLRSVTWQYLGAICIAVGYALSNQISRRGIIVAGAMGLLGWFMYLVASSIAVSPALSGGIAATIVGSIATLAGRWWRIPTHALIMAGIVPLVPGLALYRGLMQLVGSPAMTSVTITESSLTLLSAALTALAIASGASFGNMVTRPLRNYLAQSRNRLPRSRNEASHEPH